MAHYLITGHTGFKGSWLTMLLAGQGHNVSGISLDPEHESLFNKANVCQYLQSDIRDDIRNREGLIGAVQKIQPDYVIHLAAQALVLEGYRKPVETYETNVLGTLNILLATEKTDSVRAQVIVTTDKVYRNDGRRTPYVEGDSLGGSDPYSASKAAADILAQERLKRPESKPGAIARAGNVIGAGDYAKDRLIPDIIRAAQSNKTLEIRNSNAIRPWQHVLDCLNGYLFALEAAEASMEPEIWNFGPLDGEPRTVGDVLESVRNNPDIRMPRIVQVPADAVESGWLMLDSQKARNDLGWKDSLPFDLAVSWALQEKNAASPKDLAKFVQSQISHFLGINWAPQTSPDRPLKPPSSKSRAGHSSISLQGAPD